MLELPHSVVLVCGIGFKPSNQVLCQKKKIEKKLVPHELSDVSQRAVAKNSPTKQILTLFLLHHESVK